jgi:hypothetical protein
MNYRIIGQTAQTSLSRASIQVGRNRIYISNKCITENVLNTARQ